MLRCQRTLAGAKAPLGLRALPRPARLSIRASSSAAVDASTSAQSYTNNYVQPVVQPVTVNIPEPVPAVLNAYGNYKALTNTGATKAGLTAGKIFISSILAGAFIAFGAFLSVSVQNGLGGIAGTLPGLVKLIGGLIFPVGLTLVTLSGVELYTGNTATIPMALYEKKASFGGLMNNWFWCYFGNFVGSLAMVAAVAASGVLDGNSVIVKVAEYKSSLPWMTAVVRGVLANWLVCMAVWNASAAQSLPGKTMGLWGPIATFVAIGLEHSVANMFFIPMGIVCGAQVTFQEFLVNNLIPVTIGNTLAGLIMVATCFSFLYGSLGKKSQ